MSQLGQTAGMRRAASPVMNVYTVLALIALLALIVGIAAIWWQNKALFDNSNPFKIEAEQTVSLPVMPGHLA